MTIYADDNERFFLEKLSGKLGRPIPEKAPSRSISGPPDFWAKIKIDQEELINQFIVNAEKLTAKVYQITDKNNIQGKLGEVFTEINARSAILWDSPQLRDMGAVDACRNLGTELVFWDNKADRQSMIRQCASVDVGITSADYGIAITGSMAIVGNPQQSRAVSLLPPVHIALLKKENIVAHMGDILMKLNYTDMPSSLSFITGPSRTSDIEMDLALGVHGPGKVYIFLL